VIRTIRLCRPFRSRPKVHSRRQFASVHTLRRTVEHLSPHKTRGNVQPATRQVPSRPRTSSALRSPFRGIPIFHDRRVLRTYVRPFRDIFILLYYPPDMPHFARSSFVGSQSAGHRSRYFFFSLPSQQDKLLGNILQEHGGPSLQSTTGSQWGAMHRTIPNKDMGGHKHHIEAQQFFGSRRWGVMTYVVL